MKKLEFSDLDIESFENYISYYKHHSIEKINKEHPGFVEADLTMILMLLEKALEV